MEITVEACANWIFGCQEHIILSKSLPSLRQYINECWVLSAYKHMLDAKARYEDRLITFLRMMLLVHCSCLTLYCVLKFLGFLMENRNCAETIYRVQFPENV